MSQLKEANVRLHFFCVHASKSLDEADVMIEKQDGHINALENEVESLNKKIRSMQAAHRERLTKLANERHKEQQIWITQSHNCLHDEIVLHLAAAEEINNLTNKICAYCPVSVRTFGLTPLSSFRIQFGLTIQEPMKQLTSDDNHNQFNT